MKERTTQCCNCGTFVKLFSVKIGHNQRGSVATHSDEAVCFMQGWYCNECYKYIEDNIMNPVIKKVLEEGD